MMLQLRSGWFQGQSASVGGSIHCTSVEGEYAAFCLELPVLRASGVEQRSEVDGVMSA
jgi:hypothetical protein